jgi:Outer membrane efflux protein
MMYRSIPLAILLAAGLVFGQQPPAKKEAGLEKPAKAAPGSLEDTLEKALRSSADIKAAESKVRDAEAELNRVRHQVLTKATVLHSDMQVARRMLAVAEEAFALTQQGFKMGSVPQAEVLAAQSAIEKARGEVEKLDAQLKALRGEFALKNFNVSNVAFAPDGNTLWTGSADGAVRVWEVSTGELYFPYSVVLDYGGANRSKMQPVQTPMAERIRKLLDQEVEYETNDRIDLALDNLLDVAKSDIPVRKLLIPTSEPQVAMKGKLSVGAWFQAIEDSDPSIRILVRDYGILLTTKDRVPEGAVRVLDFWKSKEAKPKAESKPAEKK